MCNLKPSIAPRFQEDPRTPLSQITKFQFRQFTKLFVETNYTIDSWSTAPGPVPELEGKAPHVSEQFWGSRDIQGRQQRI